MNAMLNSNSHLTLEQMAARGTIINEHLRLIVACITWARELINIAELLTGHTQNKRGANEAEKPLLFHCSLVENILLEEISCLRVFSKINRFKNWNILQNHKEVHKSINPWYTYTLYEYIDSEHIWTLNWNLDFENWFHWTINDN